jgi:hypothetical protein
MKVKGTAGIPIPGVSNPILLPYTGNSGQTRKNPVHDSSPEIFRPPRYPKRHRIIRTTYKSLFFGARYRPAKLHGFFLIKTAILEK